MKFSFFAANVGLFIVGIVVVFLIDPLDPTTISTPFMLGIILMALSLRQSTALVVATSVTYSILTTYALVHAHQYFATHVYASPHPIFWLFQRMGLFIVVCALAIYLAYYRTASQQVLSHVQNILEKLPAPVLISDGAGYYVYANKAFTTTFGQNLRELADKRYVDIFMSDIHEGKATRYYIELFGAKENSVHELELKPFDSPTKIKARLTCLGTGPNRVMITVFSSEEEMAHSLSPAKV
jgi:transcriptional regulator with PAS, ATPase and Fis domain